MVMRNDLGQDIDMNWGYDQRLALLSWAHDAVSIHGYDVCNSCSREQFCRFLHPFVGIPIIYSQREATNEWKYHSRLVVVTLVQLRTFVNWWIVYRLLLRTYHSSKTKTKRSKVRSSCAEDSSWNRGKKQAAIVQGRVGCRDATRQPVLGKSRVFSSR